MKLLLDQGLPRSAAVILCKDGVDAVHVGDIGHSCSDDSVIMQLGRDQGRIVVTLDADFHTLLALSGAPAPSVIRIRCEGLRGEVLQTILSQCAVDLAKGASVTIQKNRIRIRLLPILQG